MLKKDLAAVEDERAVRALTVLRKHVPNLDEMQALATGTAVQPPAELSALRALTELRAPASDAVTIPLTRLQQARDGYHAAGTVTIEQAERRADLLQRALEFHQHADDGKCPVCGIGDLDAAWQQRAEQEVAAEREEISRRRRARQELDDASGQAMALIRSVREPAAPQCAITACPAAEVAWRRWQDLSADPASLIEHLPAARDDLADAFDAVSKEAEHLLAEREDAWAPLAVRLAEWVSLARKAAVAKPVVSLGVVALNFMTEAGKTLRQKRLAEVEQRARQIWAALRQDSNVDLGGIELTGTGTRRHVELHAAVDGSDAKALGVMSQGQTVKRWGARRGAIGEQTYALNGLQVRTTTLKRTRADLRKLRFRRSAHYGVLGSHRRGHRFDPSIAHTVFLPGQTAVADLHRQAVSDCGEQMGSTAP
ncbi:hypothetical protein [Kutzneria sp. NPDC051319]|uniref:hypothetical protein n=1 Tax=Kutzneria sp. NPDC051319 TaxID=3155047 RepID=UPI00341C5F33